MFDGIDDFHENQENFPYAEEASVESNEEPENIEDN